MYEIYRGAVPEDICLAARRRLLLELRRCGVSTEDMADWAGNTWWPSLRKEPEFDEIRDYLERRIFFKEGFEWADTQILVRLPDEDDTPLGGPHLDDLPPWADGLKYRGIYGVELTNTPENGGGTVLYPHGEDSVPVKPVLRMGDALKMNPDLLHSGSPNLSASIRMVLFFRLLEPA